MTILMLNRKELEKRIGKITPEMEETITHFGTPVEELTQESLSVEVFPNRPDLLCLENFALAINQFNKKEKVAKILVNPPEKDYTVIIERAVKKIRPYTVCAIVKGLDLTEEKLNELILLQEKLHGSLGRKRKKVAIGIYPLENIHLPITFTAKKPEEITFVPLGEEKEMSAKHIIKNTVAGKEYGPLLEKGEVYPVFIDSKNEILSIPPIINSQKTGTVKTSHHDLFVECSGENIHYLKKCLTIIILAMSRMGAKIYGMNIKDSSEKDFISPLMDFEELEFAIHDIEKTLGISLKESEVKDYLRKMGLDYIKKKDKSMALIPPYRTDILHWIDLAEEIAIAYGYENFDAEIPQISTIGQEDSLNKKINYLREILLSAGLLEVNTFHVISKKDAKKMHYDFRNFIELENSKTQKDSLRIDLMTNLLEIISENSDSAYPQKIFELGRVFSRSEESETKIKEKNRLAIAMAHESVSFTEMKQVLDYLFKVMDLEYTLKRIDDNNYIIGRVGTIMVGNTEIGRIGEIAPRVLSNWKIKVPVVGLEINTDYLTD